MRSDCCGSQYQGLVPQNGVGLGSPPQPIRMAYKHRNAEAIIKRAGKDPVAIGLRKSMFELTGDFIPYRKWQKERKQ